MYVLILGQISLFLRALRIEIIRYFCTTYSTPDYWFHNFFSFWFLGNTMELWGYAYNIRMVSAAFLKLSIAVKIMNLQHFAFCIRPFFYSNDRDFRYADHFIYWWLTGAKRPIADPQSCWKLRNWRFLAILTIFKQFERGRTCAKFRIIILKLLYDTT